MTRPGSASHPGSPAGSTGRIAATRPPHKLTSKAQRRPGRATALIDKLARAEITVVALPETNLFLQERGERTPIRRGITLIRELLAGGVTVRLGTDNIRDWFFPFGDGDMLETARIAAIAAHLDDEAQLIAAICDGRGTIEEGSVADLVLLRVSSFDDALAQRPAERMVFKAGRQVAGPAPP